MTGDITAFDLQVRTLVYQHFAEQGVAPTYQAIARSLDAAEETARRSFYKLHQAHMLFLEPGSDRIRMANPFSAVPTGYRVWSGQRSWWANCAWDCFGIPAALGIDARIEAPYPDAPQGTTLGVENGAVDGRGHVVYFRLPPDRWYDDLIFT